MFKIVLKYIGYFSAFTGAVGVVGGLAWGIATWVQNRNSEVDKTNDIVLRVEQQYKSLVYNDSVQIATLKSLSSDMTTIKQVTSAIDRSYIEHLKTDKRYDELIRYMDEIRTEIKKNGNNTYPIVLKQDNGTR
jgi:hypothetical protein